LPHTHGRNQLRVRANEGVIFDYSQRLVDAIIVAGNGTGADIHTRPDLGITNIGQVVGFRALPQHRFLDFNEVANVGLAAYLRTRAQARIGAYTGVVAHLRFLDMAEGFNLRAGGYDGVFDDAMRPDVNAISQLDLALEDAAHVNKYITAA